MAKSEESFKQMMKREAMDTGQKYAELIKDVGGRSSRLVEKTGRKLEKGFSRFLTRKPKQNKVFKKLFSPETKTKQLADYRRQLMQELQIRRLQQKLQNPQRQIPRQFQQPRQSRQPTQTYEDVPQTPMEQVLARNIQLLQEAKRRDEIARTSPMRKRMMRERMLEVQREMMKRGNIFSNSHNFMMAENHKNNSLNMLDTQESILSAPTLVSLNDNVFRNSGRPNVLQTSELNKTKLVFGRSQLSNNPPIKKKKNTKVSLW